jgi:cell division protein FtsQ
MRVFAFFIVLALFISGYAGFRVATWPGFDPQKFIVIGNVQVSPAEILKRAAIPKNRNIWLLGKHSAEARIETLPWIRTAEIHRALPAYVSIVVFERSPAACVRSSSQRYLVDATAHVIQTDCTAYRNLVDIDWKQLGPQQPGAVLQGDVVRRLLRDATSLRAQHLDPAVVGLDRYGGLDAILRGGLRVRFGDDSDVQRKAGLVEPILQAYGARTRDVAVIDLRAPTTPVVEERRP